MTTANPISLYMAQPSNSNPLLDSDITDNFLDFSQCSAEASKAPVTSNSYANALYSTTDGLESLDSFEEYQTPAKPSFAYDEYKQTTGLPPNSLPGIGQPFGPSTTPLPFSNTGLDESSFMDVSDQQTVPSPSPMTPFSNTGLDENFMSGMDQQTGPSASPFTPFSNTGLDENYMSGMDNTFPASTGMSINPTMVMSGSDSNCLPTSSGAFLTPPGYISPVFSPSSQMRHKVYPGVHKQMAEAHKRGTQEQHHPQHQMMQQVQQMAYQPQASQTHTIPHHPKLPVMQQAQQSSYQPQAGQTHALVDQEGIIRNVLDGFRKQTEANLTGGAHSTTISTQVVRAKKDEEEMDEDEKLLASEAGKKLTPQQRRQLRNKVSARNFRARRKDYIGQLEADISRRSKENDNLRLQNSQLIAENQNYRRALQKFIGHPQFDSLLRSLAL